MALLCLEDLSIRALVTPNGDGERVKLTLEYPRTPEYTERVMQAFSDLLRPEPPKNRRRKEATKSVETAQ